MTDLGDRAVGKAADILARKLPQWRADPRRFVREVLRAEPDQWQDDVLAALPTSRRIAMAACKGPGKSAVLAWAGWWLLACHKDAQGAALSITADNLKDGLWKELAVWRDRSALLSELFTHAAERISRKSRPKTWFMSSRSYAKDADQNEQANALAGLHAKRIFVLLDEVGDMSAGVIQAAKGIFATAGQNAWLLAAGNCTSEDGALYWITTTDAAAWSVVHITGDPDDPKRSPRIDIENARAEIKTHTRDAPHVMVNILGRFPPKGSNRLIGSNEISAAMARRPSSLAYRGEARVWGLDPARSEKAGADEAALCRRQGVVCYPILAWRGLDGPQLADRVARLWQDAEKTGEDPDAIFVDVGGVGSSAYDQLRMMGFGEIVHGVDFGGGADDPRYHDKRTEMWTSMAEWLQRTEAALPDDQVLRAELSSPTYGWGTRGKRTGYGLETKDKMKARGVRSPNRADALCLTFARPVHPRSRRDREQVSGPSYRAKVEYDPMAG